MTHNELVAGLRKLNPDIRYDETGQQSSLIENERMGGERRTTLRYKGNIISAISAGHIAENTQYTDYIDTLVPCSPTYAAKHNEEVVRVPVLIPMDNVVEYALLDQQLGNKGQCDAKFGGIPVIARRFVGQAVNGTEIPCIGIYIFYVRQRVPHKVEHLGWRQILDKVLQAKIPGVTREAVQRVLKVRLTPDVRTEEDALEAVIRKAVG